MLFKNFPEQYYHLLQSKENAVLLESTKYDQDNGYSFLFVDPIHILQIHRVSEVASLLAAIPDYLQQGYYLAGYFAYECGYHIEKLGLREYCSQKQPLAWFGVYRQPLMYDHVSGKLQVVPGLESAASLPHTAPDEITHSLSDIHFDLDEAEYRENVQRIKEYIRAGDVYQINFTGRYHFTFDGSPLSLYKTLKSRQRVCYSAYLRSAGQEILCFSPELFFSLKGRSIITRPMKGTAPRGRTHREDQHLEQWLFNDSKNRAENVMIVDLLRNDLGRICQVGSVTVPQLFSVEKYNTLFQMTSTVEGTLKEGVDYYQVFRSLFPCGSVTGAPKIRAMEIIQALERSPRGVYTGCIGYFAPTLHHSSRVSRAMFNVAIRTVVLENGRGEMGVGSGITYGSAASDEYAECMVKAHFLTSTASEFAILEGILWKDGYQRLDKHLRRLADSANYFGYAYSQASIEDVLSQVSADLVAGCSYKVRLKLRQTGQVHGEAIQLQQASTAEQIIALSAAQTDSQNSMYYHKTTQRALYDRATRFAQQNGYADMLFLNEKGEVTEGATNNIFIERNGYLLTPAVDCGLLNGIYRQYILEENPRAREAVLHLHDLLEAEKIYICNAIRGLRQVKLIIKQN
ncbi:MAG: aminodeoxychorismate synthase component I [Ktedonobacteraceae bacterium]|nr:aminodeoxychorismate synthase component I [Ktedonobacteraceae bacterium]